MYMKAKSTFTKANIAAELAEVKAEYARRQKKICDDKVTIQLYMNGTLIFIEANIDNVHLVFQCLDAFFSAPEPKAQVHYCDHALSVVRLSVCPSSVRR